MKSEDIAAAIRTRLPSAEARVSSADGTHFQAVVIAREFGGMRPLERHRLVHDALGGRMGNEIHALSFETYTPEEWAARQSG